MTEKRMEAITITRDGAGLSLLSPDVGSGEQIIYIPFEQVPIVSNWLMEMLEDYEKETGESANG